LGALTDDFSFKILKLFKKKQATALPQKAIHFSNANKRDSLSLIRQAKCNILSDEIE